MRKNMLNKLLVICGLLAMVSCKAKKQLIARKPADSTTKTANTLADKLNAIKSTQLNFNTFSGKAHSKLDVNGSKYDVTLNIRMAKGKKIWVSITAIAGIEVARAMITPDSILVINKLQGLYLKKPFSYIYTYTGKQVDYSSIEAILIGNAMPQLLTENAQLKTDSASVMLTGNLDNLMYHLITGLDMRVTETDLTDQTGDMSVTVNNSQFIQAGNRVMPSQINISSTVKTRKFQVGMSYSKEDFDLPLEFPFNIPSSYSPAN
jgi:hypothetical protein